MRPVGLIASVFLLISSAAVSAQPSSDDAVKTELRALMTELNAALAAKDRAALERIYADEFLFVHALGAPVGKKEQIDSALASTQTALPATSFDGLLVYGPVAVLRRPVDGRFGTTIYAKKDGRWQIVQLQGTAIPYTRTAAAVATDILRFYAGRYEQDNGLFLNITLEGDALAVQVDGRQKLTLTADSDTKFSLPAAAGQFTFKKSAEGAVSYELIRANGTIVKGTRQK